MKLLIAGFAVLMVAVAQGAAAEPYCQKGAAVETQWVGEWLPRVVEGGPDDLGKCLLSGGDNPPSWVSRDRIRPVGGGTFTEVAPTAPAVGTGMVAPDMDAPVVYAEDDDAASDSDAPQGQKDPKMADLDQMMPGVYLCSAEEGGLDTDSTFGIIDGEKYNSYAGSPGKYSYNEGTGILELFSGGNKGLKYKRTDEKVFTLLNADKSKSETECTLKVGKDPRGSGW